MNIRSIARFMIRLYPGAWRARYGEEFAALVDDTNPRLSTIFDLSKGAIQMQSGVRSFPRLALLFSILGLAAGFGVSYLVTPRYTSTAELKITDAGDNSTALSHFSEIRDEVLSRTVLSTIIQDPRLDLYARDREKLPLQDVIETMRTRDVKIFAVDHVDVPQGSYVNFRIQVTYSNPRLTQQVTQTFVTKFIEDLYWKQRDVAENGPGADRVTQLEQRIAILEQRLGIAAGGAAGDAQRAWRRGPVEITTIDAPDLPESADYPNRGVFMASGFGAGFVLALVIAAIRRPVPLPPPQLA